ncbi:hypothetical protein [Tabrizicola flagellatus]|uniref:hypothetical protein n=1 Tax=Tabrizicola flagellatus TaxID=2593021 RepID=UPI0011F0D865|nr:hypothetical protein [Tabrizicola flagellatus]
MTQTRSRPPHRARATAEAAAGSGAEPIRKSSRGRVLRVIGPARGRWRAGRHFTAEAVEIPIAELAEDDLQRIEGDPQLKVIFIDQN